MEAYFLVSENCFILPFGFSEIEKLEGRSLNVRFLETIFLLIERLGSISLFSDKLETRLSLRDPVKNSEINHTSLLKPLKIKYV